MDDDSDAAPVDMALSLVKVALSLGGALVAFLMAYLLFLSALLGLPTYLSQMEDSLQLLSMTIYFSLGAALVCIFMASAQCKTRAKEFYYGSGINLLRVSTIVFIYHMSYLGLTRLILPYGSRYLLLTILTIFLMYAMLLLLYTLFSLLIVPSEAIDRLRFETKRLKKVICPKWCEEWGG